MRSKSKFIAGLVLGAAAGAAVALFLHTEKGKEIVSNIKDLVDETISQLLQKGKQLAESIETEIKDAAETA